MRSGPLMGLLLVTLVVSFAQAIDTAQMQRVLTERFGDDRIPVFEQWRRLVANAQQVAESKKLELVNDFFNRHTRFSDDPIIWKQPDYWATPVETIGRAAGDCEDFSVAKYFTLRELGVPAERLRLTYVRARIGGGSSPVTQAHMVVSYYPTPNSEPLVLDNLVGSIRLASKRPDFAPVFSFNMDSIYVGGRKKSATPMARLSRWRDLLLRVKAEGYEP